MPNQQLKHRGDHYSECNRFMDSAIKKRCAFCNKALYLYPCQVYERNYCSIKCRGANKTKNGVVKHRCKICGKEGTSVKSHQKKYCSRLCKRKGQSGKGNPNYRGNYISKQCVVCKQLFIAKTWIVKNTQVTCSKKCGNKLSAITRSKSIIVQCIICGKKFKDSLIHGALRKTCSYKCMAEYYKTILLGKNNPNWKNGLSHEPYPMEWSLTLKESIRQRDNFKCQICNIHQSVVKIKLHIHHIDYDKKNLNPNNLISLCINCHVKTNGNRKYWKELFNERNINKA